MILSYKYRLYPNREQRATLDRLLEIHRVMYNDALTERRLAWKMSKVSIRYIDQANQLKGIRQFDDDLAFANYSSLQQTLRRLQKSFDGFFRRINTGQKAGYPRYKGRGWFKSITYVYEDGCRIRNGRLYVQRVGDLRLFQHRDLPEGKIKMLVIKRDRTGNWFAIFQVDIGEAEKVKRIERSIGIDMGLEFFLSLSNGVQIDNPRWYRTGEEKLATLQRRRSRCKRGSRKYVELTRQIQRHHQMMANRRKDFQHKLSSDLVKKYGVIIAENLDVKGLAQSWVSKSMGDAGWSQFLLMLSYKAERAGGKFVQVDCAGSSQECPVCGSNVRKKLRERVHRCSNCGCIIPRDVAAAKVIENRGRARTEPWCKVNRIESPVARSSPL